MLISYLIENQSTESTEMCSHEQVFTVYDFKGFISIQDHATENKSSWIELCSIELFIKV